MTRDAKWDAEQHPLLQDLLQRALPTEHDPPSDGSQESEPIQYVSILRDRPAAIEKRVLREYVFPYTPRRKTRIRSVR